MNDENRFDSYLAARASGLELPPANLGTVIDRVAQRRRHRRTAVSAFAAVAVLGGALSVVNIGGSDTPDHVVAGAGSANLVASTLEWSAVTPRSGLSWSTATVLGPDDALYSLSTAPGSTGDDGSQSVLYRSTDGIEWAATTLPDGLHPSSLASSGQSIYAVGTSPAGGSSVGVQLASSTTGGASWSKVDVPLDIAALESRFGFTVGINRTDVASNGTHTVVAVAMSVQDDIHRLVPGTVAGQGISVGDDGITVFAAPDASPVEAKEDRRTKEPEVVATHTWQQLGVDDALRSLILGETRVFVSEAGAPFAPAAVLNVRSSGSLFSTADGFRLVASSDQTTTLLMSVDGRTWQADPLSATPGWAIASGVRRDMAALVAQVYGPTGDDTSVIRMQRSGGTWTEIDLDDVLQRAGATGSYNAGPAAVGPLGVAVIMTEARDGEDAQRYLVTTTDGTDVSVIDLGSLLGDGYAGDVRVTADAITIAVTGEGKDAPQQLLVGTPRR